MILRYTLVGAVCKSFVCFFFAFFKLGIMMLDKVSLIFFVILVTVMEG